VNTCVVIVLAALAVGILIAGLYGLAHVGDRYDRED